MLRTLGLCALAAVVGCGRRDGEDGSKRYRSSLSERTVAETLADSLVLEQFDPSFAQAVALSDSTFAVRGHPNDPLCVIVLPARTQRCRKIVGAGPGEVESLEHLAVWPPNKVGVWDRQSGTIGVWNDSLTLGETIDVVGPSAEGYDLYGVQTDSTLVVGRGERFMDMPLGVFPSSYLLRTFRHGKPVASAEVRVKSSWISVVSLPDGARSGTSIRAFPEMFVHVYARKTIIVDGRECTVRIADGTPPKPLIVPNCPGPKGFRDNVLRQLENVEGAVGKRHREMALESAIPERFTGIVDIEADASSGELLARLRTDSGETSTRWVALDSTHRPATLFMVPQHWRMVAASSHYMLFVRRDTDVEAAPSAIYWMRREARN
ncbi:MAG: hypothetical protein IT353_10425 [Gemmatimonadaceae bacterium]|nr:hypothetical protein [Gemmatimonadaceae bacterium]